MPNRRNTLYLFIIGALVVGTLTGRSVFFNLAGLVGALLFTAAIWSWLALRGVGIARVTRSQRTQVGRDLEETFVITNRALIPKLWLEIDDESTLPNHRAGHVVPALAPRGSYRWEVSTRCMTRGEYRLGPITVTSGDPFGLYTPQRRLAAVSNVIVYPKTLPITEVELPGVIFIGGEAERRRTNRVSANPIGVREYAPGDSFNRIHWKTSARTQRLMVKKFEIEPTADIWLFVDLAATSHIALPSLQRTQEGGYALPNGEDIPPATEEYAVVAAASMAQHFAAQNRALGFTAYVPARVVHSSERGSRQLLHILETLAVARARSLYTFDQMLTLETPTFTHGTTVILVTASMDEAWVDQAAILQRRGVQPFAVLIDPSSFGGVGAGLNTPPSGAGTPNAIRPLLQAAHIPSIIIHRGDNLTAALAQTPF